ncbi:MAG: sulfite exporter TauE/SafE family protein [Betaproteobacteria bacterium]|nr:sulfite exporter TauE/SafE family protein [Betaproteobacteria bacterium]
MIDGGYVVAGALTGFMVGLTGVGGGALMTPILLLFFGIAPTTAIATDLWFAAITKVAAARIHQRRGQVDWQVVRRLWMGSLPVAALTVLVVAQGSHAARAEWLGKAVGLVVLVTAVGLLLAPWLSALARGRRLGHPQQFKATQPLMTVLAGAVLGLCVALTSVGAGTLGTVMLLYLYPLRMKPHKLVATDIVHAIPLAVIAGLGYLMAGMTDGHMLLSLLAGSLPAVVAGSLLAGRLNGRPVQMLLGLVLLATGLKTVL